MAMIRYHPDDNLLTEYASGSLAWAVSLSVCAHLQFCPHCRKRVETLNKLGGAILTTSVVEKIEPQTFTQLMDRIRQQKNDSGKSEVAPSTSTRSQDLYHADPTLNNLPKVIAKLLPADGKLKWQRVSASLRRARLVAGQDKYEVAFQKISSGGTVVEHDHRGLEVTLLLHGSFSDENGVYSEGDFLVRNPGEVHRPTATQNQDCLCLSVSEGPVEVTGLLGKIINPFLGFKPA
jgi:putative transcriptional regulator